MPARVQRATGRLIPRESGGKKYKKRCGMLRQMTIDSCSENSQHSTIIPQPVMNRIYQGTVIAGNSALGYWLSDIGHSPKALVIGYSPKASQHHELFQEAMNFKSE